MCLLNMRAVFMLQNLFGLRLALPAAFLVYYHKREKNFFFAKRLGLPLLWSSTPVNCLNLMVIFFLATLASCIFPWLISSFLFAFRFPVIRFENFCLAVNRLGSRIMVNSVISAPAHYKSCVYSKILIVE